MKKNNKTTSISNLLHSSAFNEVMGGSKLNLIVKHSTIFSFWNTIVGSKFSNFTKPYSIKGNKLYVSAKSPIVAQELSLYKTKILSKVNSYSNPLGLEIKDIIFNYKNYAATNPVKNNENEDKPIFFNRDKLKDIQTTQQQDDAFKKSVDKINFLNEEQKEILTSKIIDNVKAKQIQEIN